MLHKNAGPCCTLCTQQLLGKFCQLLLWTSERTTGGCALQIENVKKQTFFSLKPNTLQITYRFMKHSSSALWTDYIRFIPDGWQWCNINILLHSSLVKAKESENLDSTPANPHQVPVLSQAHSNAPAPPKTTSMCQPQFFSDPWRSHCFCESGFSRVIITCTVPFQLRETKPEAHSIPSRGACHV